MQSKVQRSKDLLMNLSQEKNRWEESSMGFKNQIGTITGDCLLSGGFLTYVGFFDHYHRQTLLNLWKKLFENLGIKFRFDMSLVEFLSKPSDRLLW